MNIKTKKISSAVLGLVTLGLCASSIAFSIKANRTETVGVMALGAGYTNHDGDTYYNGISDTLAGDSLLSALRSLNSSKRKSTVGYGGMGTSVGSSKFIYTDYDPDSTLHTDSNGQVYGDKVLSFYSSHSTDKWNREHVWPDSHGGNVVEADIHMPRPTIEKENGSRGNSFYVEGKCDGSKGWDPAMEDFGVESYRGDSARIIFYCVVANSKLSLIDEEYHSTSRDNNDYLMGKLSDMLAWNIKYPVQQRERNRNEGAEYLQGNRNPFIDHPEYACKIWGDYNDATRAACRNTSQTNYVYLNKGNLSLKVGETSTLTATTSDGSTPTLTWTTSNSDVATVTNGTVSAIGAGSATITVTCTVGGETVNATCSVVVKAPSAGGDFEKYTGTITEGEYVICDGSNALGNTITSNRIAASTVSISNGVIESPSDSVIWTLASSGNNWTLQNNDNGKFAAGTGSKNQGALVDSATDAAKWTISGSSTYEIVNVSNSGKNVNANLRFNSSVSAFATYSTGTGSALTLYKKNGTTPATKALSSIAVSNAKTEYNVGDTFVKPTVTATYTDNTTADVTSSTTFTGYNMENAGTQTVTATYAEGKVSKSVTFQITVKSATPAKTLTSIAVSGQKTEYKVNDEFVKPTVTATYSDGSTEDVTTSATFSGYDMTKEGTQTVTVSYEGKTTSYEITVTADTPDPTPDPTPDDNGGCGGSAIASSILLCMCAVSGLTLALIRRKKIKEEE